ncbi:hypothetical protein JCM3774_003720 [Rhodotorula dairenensis]
MLRCRTATPTPAAWQHRVTAQARAASPPWPLRPLATGAASPASPRSYFYDVDIHGQLFLSDAKHRNVATAYRDVRFLDVFFARIRRNQPLATSAGEEARRARSRGYEFVSECMGEVNYVRPDSEGTPLVFQSLDGSELRYAGSLSHPFDPAALRVNAATGYLFHPSPVSGRSNRAHAGPYSLLRSSLVLEHFGPSLELDTGTEGGGSFEYRGRRFPIKPLQEGDVWPRQQCDVDPIT